MLNAHPDCAICRHIRREPHLAEICEECDLQTNPDQPKKKFQSFRYMQYEWSINKAEELIAKRRKRIPPITVNVDQIYNQIKWHPHPLGVTINRDYAMTQADLSKPIIFGLIKVKEGWFNVLIDGHHRLYRAKHEGVKDIKAHILTKLENSKCLIGPFGMPTKR